MATNTGNLAEINVAHFLAKRGFKILAKNVRYPFGEVDLIAQEGKTLVFVEVKYRKNLDFGLPCEAVGKSKQRKIILAAQAYLQSLARQPLCRFDVISVWGDPHNPHIDHIRDAFSVEEN